MRVYAYQKIVKVVYMSMQNNNRLVGMVYIITSASVFGVMPFWANQAYASEVDPTTLMLLRFGMAAVIMWGIVGLTGARVPRGNTLVGLGLMGGVGYAGQAFSYFTALQFAPAGVVAVLLYLFPALVTLLAWRLYHQRLTQRKALALFLSLSGIVLVVGVQSGAQMKGIGLALLAALIYAVYIMAGAKITAQADMRSASAVIFSAAAVVYALYGVWHGVHLPVDLSGWLASAALALVGTVLAVWCFFEGVKRIGAVDASMLSTLEPVVTVVCAWLWFGERLNALNVLGAVMIIMAALMLAKVDDTH